MKRKKPWKSIGAIILGAALLAGCGGEPALESLDRQLLEAQRSGTGDQGQGGQKGQGENGQDGADSQGQGGQKGQGENGQEDTGSQGQDGERITLTLGGLNISWELERAVEIYNARNGKYFVEIIDYEEDNEREAARDRLCMDLATGKGTDIVAVCDLFPDVLGHAGVLLDLNAFITAESREEKYLGNILECAQTGSALCQISPAFSLSFIVGDGSKLGMESGWTMEEMMESFQKCGRDGTALGRGTVRTVGQLMEHSMDDYVDWDKGTADFCKEEFYRILEFGREADNGSYVRTTRQSVASGVHLASCEGLGQAADVQYLRWMFGDNMAVKGWPASHGTGVGVGFDLRDSLGICTYSRYPEGAWDFLEFFVEADWIGETQAGGYHYGFSHVFYGFPVSRKKFEEVLEESMVQYYYEDTGKPYPLLQGEGEIPDFYANSAEDVEEIRRIIALADGRCFDNQSVISQIIEEEIGGYNAGALSAQQTAEKIENRVQLYLDEMGGRP